MAVVKDPIIIDNFSYASPTQRILAFAIDYVIAMLLAVIPVLGFTLSFLYLITKDGLNIFIRRSIGKKVMGIRVVKSSSYKISLMASVKRNIFLLPNALLIVFGQSFFYIVLILNALAAIIEVFQLYTNDNSERLGDQLADTTVVEDNN